MPNYRFLGTDSTGQQVEGAVEADSAELARRLLTQQGYRVRTVFAPSDPLAAPAVPSPRPVERPSQQSIQSPAVRPVSAPSIHRTAWGNDNANFFIFSQVAAYLRAGVSPVQAFANVGQAQPREDYRKALLDVGRSAVEGKRVSDILETYPYLFPPHVIGVLRAGELAGNLPEACDRIAGQAQDSHRFKRVFLWLKWTVLSTLASIPGGVLAVRAAVESWDRMEVTGGSGDNMAVIGQAFLNQTLRVGIPVALGMFLVFWLGTLAWRAMPLRRLRHRLVRLVPGVGRRAHAESLEAFSWGIGTLSRAGLSPRSALVGAAACMPNLWLREELEGVARQMSDSDRLSQALRGSRILPPEFAPVLTTGEMVGDLAGQMGFIQAASREELDLAERNTKSRLGCWVVLVFVIGSAILMGMVYGWLYPVLMQRILGE